MLHSSGMMQKILSQLLFQAYPLPTRGGGGGKAFQVAVIRWYYVYDPWRNIKGVGGGEEGEIKHDLVKVVP